MQQDSREFILETAFSLFLRKSYKAVTLKEIMDKTGFSKGAFYHYFQNKEAVFETIMNDYFQSHVYVDFSRFSQTRLLDFIHDYQDYSASSSAKLTKLNQEESVDTNHYFLLFEALKLLPDFKARVQHRFQQELMAWVSVIKTAKETGEIHAGLSDEQLARLFIYASDGTALQLVMQDGVAHMQGAIGEAWGALYHLIKS